MLWECCSRLMPVACGLAGLDGNLRVVGWGCWSQGRVCCPSTCMGSGATLRYPSCQPACLCCPCNLAATLDLHFLTVMGCRVVLRAWLLHLKRSALAGHALAPGTPIRIVTGTHFYGVPRMRGACVPCNWQALSAPLHAVV